jgi:hypothetical protein
VERERGLHLGSFLRRRRRSARHDAEIDATRSIVAYRGDRVAQSCELVVGQLVLDDDQQIDVAAARRGNRRA